MPLYNKRAYVERALRSVISQSYPPAEIIVVDDGSTDGGHEVLAAFPTVTALSQVNAGPAAARNLGVDTARGDWIAFLDADDEWLPHFLSSSLAAAIRFPAAIAVFTNLVDEVGHRLVTSDGEGAILVDDYFQFLLDHHGLGMSSSSTIVRRHALIASGGFPAHAKRGEDVDTWARLAWSGSVVFVAQPLAIYHTEVPGSVLTATDDGDPGILQTYTAWSNSGRIPAHLAGSSRRFLDWLVRHHVASLAHDGRKREAWRLLHAVDARVLSSRAFAIAALRLLIPAAALRTLRRVKGRLTN